MAMRYIPLGKFIRDDAGTYHGRISGLGMGSTSVISEEALSADGKSYLKLVGDPFGAAYEIGVAFPGEKDGKQYCSVILDSPVLAAPIRAVLFPDREEPNGFNLLWNRPELKPGYEATAQAGQNRRYVGAGASMAP